MKNTYFLVLLLSGTMLAQDYQKHWEKVITYEQAGKIKSANEVVSKIYRKAKRHDNEPQVVKSFFYRSKYLFVLDWNAQRTILENLETETRQASVPARSLFSLIYAQCLLEYIKKQHYHIQKRTAANLPLSKDISLWSSADFEREIQDALANSLSGEAALQATPLKGYEQVFDFLSAERFNRETLYEYVLMENIRLLTQRNSHYISEKDNPELLPALSANTNDFIMSDLNAVKDANAAKILRLFQKLEAFRPSAKNRFGRIKFVHEHLDPNHLAYISLLESLQKEASDTLLKSGIRLEKATALVSASSRFPGTNYLDMAIRTLDSIIGKAERTNADAQARELRQRITARSLSVTLQSTVYPFENTRASVSFKNVDSLEVSYYRIGSGAQSWPEQLKLATDSLIGKIRLGKPMYAQSYALGGRKDYSGHSAEIALPQIDTGTYLAYFETNGYDDTTKATAYKVVTATNIALLGFRKDDTSHFAVVNRKNGSPIADAIIKNPDYELTTDSKGEAKYHSQKYNYRQRSEVIFGRDTLVVSDFHFYENRQDEEPRAKSQLYLDRAIYRPGQTVFYKGIAMRKDGEKTSVVPGLRLSLTVSDPNKDIYATVVTTNDFGSFSGEFKIPESGLTGDYEIALEEPDNVEDDEAYDEENDEHPFWDRVDFQNDYTSFKVEEYKRPKFEVKFEPVKEAFTLGKNATLTGSAKAYAGSNVTGARVIYNIRQEGRYSYKERRYVEGKEISIDTVKTDENGRFTINFIPGPDEDEMNAETHPNHRQLPVYEYNIKASVTDVNGETHEAETAFRVGRHALQTTVSALQPEMKKENTVLFTSTNLNGQFLATRGKLDFYRIKRLPEGFKPRQFAKPEIENWTQAEFKALFPYEFDESDLYKNLDTTSLRAIPVDTGKNTQVTVDFSDLPSGDYKVVFTATDDFGNTIKSESGFTLTDPKLKIDPSKLFALKLLNSDPKKDGYALIRVTSPIANLNVRIMAAFGQKVFFEQLLRLAGNESTVRIALQKDFWHGITVGADGFYDNFFHTAQLPVNIEMTTPKLLFETVSFRSKIEPGTPETWSFRLSAKNTELESELLASMYDASLDTFAADYWESPGFGYYYSPHFSQRQFTGNHQSTIQLRNLDRYVPMRSLRVEETQLIRFGFSFNNDKPVYSDKLYKEQISKKAHKPAGARVVSGIVSDESGPLPGANVVVKSTQRGVQTDIDGYFEIEVAIGEELVFSFVGMEDRAVTVGAYNQIDVRLEVGDALLGEVVVTGAMGITRKMDTQTSSQTIISDDEISQSGHVNSVLELVGKVSGLQINTTNTGVNTTTRVVLRGNRSLTGDNAALLVIDGEILTMEEFQAMRPEDISSVEVLKGAQGSALYGNRGANGVIIVTTKKAVSALAQVKARTNLSETAFFFPHLRTDEKGNVVIRFTSPEALTSWKFRLMAHNKKGGSGLLQETVNTQKSLMVLPNFPRFLREKDSIAISAKVANMTAKAMTGTIALQFSDAATMQSVDATAMNTKNVKTFTIPAYGNSAVNWKIYVPEGLAGMQYRIVAQSGSFSDGEESILPVLSNNKLVTEAVALWVRENTAKEYLIDNLKNNTSATLRNHQLTLEYTSNPTWLALQSLPYLMEYQHECAEQTFARFYANALATTIIGSNPKIATVLDDWRKNGKTRLEQNVELKSILMAETPWLDDAKSEGEKKQKLALLFDLDKMKQSRQATFEKLLGKQKESGGFGWFDGSPENEYITRHIVAGLGHLKKLGAAPASENDVNAIAKKAVAFLDRSFEQWQIKDRQDKKRNYFRPYSDMHYLYVRSFFLTEYPLPKSLNADIRSGLQHIAANWLTYRLYEKGLAALVLHRFDETATALKILESLEQTSASDETSGMHWAENKPGWYWYQAPIETQALLIEAFAEITPKSKSIDAMKAWLLKNKEQKNWPTTKATTEAVYALLLQGSDWLNENDNTVFRVGNDKIATTKMAEIEKEIGTGYVKINWTGSEIKKEMASLSVNNKSGVPGFGGYYWQYFEDLDKIKGNAGGPLSVSQELFRKTTLSGGVQLQKIEAGEVLKIGETVTVRIEVRASEDLEFVHLKSMRGSCFEPVDVLSGYNWAGGIGYYKSTKDAAMHFFFDQINKGVYVFEYEVWVNNSGDFSNGITTIQSMYAPEFNGHTKGIRIKVK